MGGHVFGGERVMAVGIAMFRAGASVWGGPRGADAAIAYLSKNLQPGRAV